MRKTTVFDETQAAHTKDDYAARNVPSEEELISMQVNRVFRNTSGEPADDRQPSDLPEVGDLLLRVTGDLVFVTDSTGIILDASKNACNFLGYSLEEIRYFNLNEIFSFSKNAVNGVLDYVREEASSFEASMVTAKNACIPVVLQGYYVRFRGSKARMIHADILAQQSEKGGEQALDNQTRQLSERIIDNERGAIQKSGFDPDLLKTSFLSNMSHEIRTPMNAIVGFANLLDDPGITPDLAKEYTAIIRSSSQNLMLIMDNILELSQVESAKFTINRKNTFLPQLFKDMMNTFREIVSSMEKTILLEVSLPSAFTVDVNIDQLRVKQVFSNLLHNAIKFSENGTIVFGCKSFSGSEVEFFVSDQGIGIPKEEVDSVFNRFWHGNHKLNRKYGGTGLGLTISRCLVEKMGGTIHVESIEGKGSVFSFTLPAGITEYTDHPVQIHSISEIPKAECDHRFLVAEDEEVNFFLLREMLGQFGITPVWARNGEDVVTMVREEKFDLVLMDMKMPGINGFEATRIIREFDADLPIIALTAYAMEEDRQHCLDAGCNNYLAKPVMRDDLFSMIRQYCKGEMNEK
ncbi:MAG: response regulator [Bacteroidales bacterium]